LLGGVDKVRGLGEEVKFSEGNWKWVVRSFGVIG
jgi:hypothetical protein